MKCKYGRCSAADDENGNIGRGCACLMEEDKIDNYTDELIERDQADAEQYENDVDRR